MNRSLLTVIQHADGLFPSGSFAFSQGLEATAALCETSGPLDIGDFIACQIRHRWRGSDRVALVRAYRCSHDLDALEALDREVEASTPNEAFRLGSRRNGGALLTAHERIGTPGAAEWRTRVRAGAALGHLPVVQGILWSRLGIAEGDAVLMSGYASVSGILTAAVRLAIIGAIDAQRILSDSLPLIVEATAEPVADDQPLSAFIPVTEAAVLRHGGGSLKLFSN